METAYSRRRQTKRAGQCSHGAAWPETPLVSILVLNWNGKQYLRPCLESLRSDICSHVELVVVDNGSSDGSVLLVQEEFPEVKVVVHAGNLGFSRAYNGAVTHVGGSYLVFLNNDTEVERGWLEPLIDQLLERPEIGIVACKLLFFGTRILNGAGGYTKLWTGGGELGFGLDESAFPGNRVIEPFYASGAAMAIRRQLFEHLGGFDEAMFSYGEDSDLAWRARLSGYRVAYCPNSVVHHHFSATWKAFDPHKLRMTTRHRLRGMLKCLSVVNVVHSIPAYMSFALAKGTALSVIESKPSYLLSVLLAFGDIMRSSRDLWRQRSKTQALRVVPDRDVLNSENFGLLTTPWQLWRALGVAKRAQAGRRQ